MTVVTIVVSIACFIVGGFASYVFFKHGLKSKYDSILKEAETEAEVIKKNKLLEVKEKFLNKKADLEKEVSLRNQKIQQAENKLKQRELVLNQRQEEIQRKKLEAEAVKENLANSRDYEKSESSRHYKTTWKPNWPSLTRRKRNWNTCNARKSRNWKLSQDFLPKRPKSVW